MTILEFLELANADIDSIDTRTIARAFGIGLTEFLVVDDFQPSKKDQVIVMKFGEMGSDGEGGLSEDTYDELRYYRSRNGEFITYTAHQEDPITVRINR